MRNDDLKAAMRTLQGNVVITMTASAEDSRITGFVQHPTAGPADLLETLNLPLTRVAFAKGSSRILVASVQNGGFLEASTPASNGSPMGVQKAVSAEQRSSRLPALLARYWRAIGALLTGISLPKLRPRRA